MTKETEALKKRIRILTAFLVRIKSKKEELEDGTEVYRAEYIDKILDEAMGTKDGHKCEKCGTSLEGRHGATKLCMKCSKDRSVDRQRVLQARVKKEKKGG